MLGPETDTAHGTSELSMNRAAPLLACLLVMTLAPRIAAEPPADFPFAAGDRIDQAGSKALALDGRTGIDPKKWTGLCC